MDNEIKQLWLTALRSGKYKQGKERLLDTDTNQYCCLGVLADACEILNNDGCIYAIDGFFLGAKDLFSVPVLNKELSLSIQQYLINCNDNFYPNFVFRYLPTKIQNKIKKIKNYKHPKTFNEIADWIEKYL